MEMCRYLSLETEWPSLYDFLKKGLLFIFFGAHYIHNINNHISILRPVFEDQLSVRPATGHDEVSLCTWLATTLCLCRVLTERSLSRISHGPWICCEMRNMPIWMAFGNYTVHPQARTGLCMNNWLLLEYLFSNSLVDQQIPSQTVQSLLFL